MTRNFVKTAFGYFILAIAFTAALETLFAILKYIIFLRLPMTVFEWISPIIFAGLYTFYIYKDNFPPSFKFRVALYGLAWTLITMTLLFIAVRLATNPSIIPSYILPYLSANYLDFLNTSDVKDIALLTYIGCLILSPLIIAYQYIVLTIGNIIGLWFMKKYDEAKN